MGQQQKKRTFSLGTKLLLIVVLLISLLTAFLNTSAIMLLKDEKETQTFQSKSTEAMLAGSQISTVVGHVLDTLRLSLASADPRNASPGKGLSALKSILDNQTDALALSTFRIKPESLAILPVSQILKAQSEVRELDLELHPDWLKAISRSLQDNNYGFINLSSEGRPLLGVVIALMSETDSAGYAPAALGVISLARLSEELAGLNLSIVTRSGGWILFDTDTTQFYSRGSLKLDPFFQFANFNKASNGTHDFEVDGERYLGSYVQSSHGLLVLTRIEWHTVMKSTYAITEKFILLGLMAIGAGIVFAILFSKTLTAPLLRLSSATRQVSAGNFQLALAAESNDEIGELTESFNSMSSRIDELFRDNADRIQMENEINIASTVQQNLIPPPEFLNSEVEIRSYYQSAGQCGGDWWGFFRCRDRLVIGIADATGHGLQCALITAAARSAFSVLQKMAEENPHFDFSTGRMLDFFNRAIHDSASGRIMMTAFIGVLDLSTGTLAYSNAGHNPPWLYRLKDGAVVLKSLTAQGERLGESNALNTIEEKSVATEKGDILFLYTDGLLECLNTEGEMYGKKRVRKALEPALAGGPATALDSLLNDFNAFHVGKGTEDDVTIAILRILNLGTKA